MIEVFIDIKVIVARMSNKYLSIVSTQLTRCSFGYLIDREE